jgi:hypothetical protein
MSRKRALFVLLTLAFCVIGYLGVRTYLFWLEKGASKIWHSLGIPSEPVSKIATIYPYPVCDDGAEVYLETVAGKIIGCAGQTREWHEIIEPITPVSGWNFAPMDKPEARWILIQVVGLPPGVSYSAVKNAAVLWTTEVYPPIYFIVLQDNSVWRCEVPHYWYSIGLPLLVGFFVGGYLLVIVRLIRRVQKKP